MLSTTKVIEVKILIVEDEGIVAEDIKDSLEAVGYAVTDIADSGKQAIEIAAETQPNLVLMDMRLKGKMDGVEAAKHIWNRFNIPIIYLTANSDTSTLERAKATNPFGYITKPFRERDLHTAIEIALHRHHLERKLKEREQWLDTILNSIGDAVIATDTQNRITLINPVGEALTGWQQENALGRNSTEVLNIVHEKTRSLVESPIAKALETGDVVALPEQTLLISKNGAEIPIDDSAAPLEDSQGAIAGAVIVFRDISDRKEAEKSRLAQARTEQLEVQMAELEKLNQLKDDFLSTVSHELRTPMANIKMAIEMLKVTLAQMPKPSAARYLQILNTECEREIELINNLLDLQRLEAGEQPIHAEIINLQTWLPKLIEPFHERAKNRQLNLEVQVPAELPPLISDSASLERIVVELLNNACKYTPPGEKIMLVACVENKVIQLQVINSYNFEIPASELLRIFDKFYRVPSADPWKQGGTGLGLALVKKLAEHLRGSISVESACNQICFTVELPIDMHTNHC